MSKAYQQSANGIAGEFSTRIDALFSEWDRDKSPGAAVTVISNGAIIHERGYGVANVENDVPLTRDTVLRLGSVSKHFCATCVLILQNRGKLDLSDDIRRYVPELHDFGTVITLRHLLTMTSGLWDGFNLLLFCGLNTSSTITRSQMLNLFQCQRKLMFAPGDNFQYSNTNFALLSLVVERVSGKPLANFMQDEIFAPLEMHDTALVPFDSRITGNKARGYTPAADGLLESGLMHLELCGDGGIDSTISDMTRWFSNYRDDRVFGPDYRQRMEEETRLNDDRLVDYRLGINVSEYRGLLKVGHSGGMPGFLCDFVFFPATDLGVILLANLSAPELLELPERISDIVLENRFSKPLQSTFVSENDPSAATLRGVFASWEHGLIAEIVIDAGKLVCYLLGDANPVIPIGGNRFALADQGTVLELPNTAEMPDASERPVIRLISGCQPPISLEPVPDPRARAAPEAEKLKTLAGSYYSDELKETHDVNLQEGHLHVKIPCPVRRLEWEKLVPVSGDLFGAMIAGEPSCTNVAVRFLRDTNGVCRGLRYSINRCHDVLFRKLN